MLSLLTNTPLTNMVFVGSKLQLSSLGIKSCISSNSVQPKMVKLVVQKSTNKVLCAQVDNFFVELLFSFLTIPLGAVKHLVMDSSSPVSINKVYQSIASLGDRKYLKTEGIATRLLCPKVAANYHRLTDLLPIYDKRATPDSFLKEQATFIVSDDLEIAFSPSISTILKFTFGIHVDDLEVLEVSIGEAEALSILNASLTSMSVLTDCLNAFRKNANTKSLT